MTKLNIKTLNLA